jgi:hypothetical protein
VDPDAPCVPDCAAKQCGSDGCGGVCGLCTSVGFSCQSGKCAQATAPKTCAEAHGSVGCCFGNSLFWFEAGSVKGGIGACGPVMCGWDAGAGNYACGFSDAEPTGKYPMDCHGENPAPETCPVCTCEGKKCGSDGCGGFCGGCVGDEICGADGQCKVP